MRWECAPKEGLPKLGTIRQRTAFLWCPLTIGGETRWLETATWQEEFQYHGHVKISGEVVYPNMRNQWRELLWAHLTWVD